MRYLQDLDVQLEEPVVFALLVELGAPTIGELSRQEFIEGWSRMRYVELTNIELVGKI